jgi:peptidoglycan/xylan/chitin deacetylase (PgdA/CDA1 family)
MYHDVATPGQEHATGFSGNGAEAYKLSVHRFIEHLEAIRPNRIGTLRDARNIQTGVVLLTFDDGGLSFFSPIADLLEERGWRGHFFITTDWIGKPGFLTAAQIEALHRRGHIIGSHSCSHPTVMSKCTVQQLREEWRNSTRILARITGEPVRVASVPGGYYSRHVAETAAEAGIEILFNSEPVSRLRHVQTCTVLGRFTITSDVSASECSALASGRGLPAVKQMVLWNAKKLVKAAALSPYLWLRRQWFS